MGQRFVGRGSVSASGIVWLFATTVLAFVFLGWVRTPEFGPTLVAYRVMGFALLFLLPHVVLALMCLCRRRRAVVGAFIWTVVLIAAVEGYAQAQEWRFKVRCRDLPPSAETVVERRWWPFHAHDLVYLPKTGKWLANC